MVVQPKAKKGKKITIVEPIVKESLKKITPPSMTKPRTRATNTIAIIEPQKKE